MDTTFDLQNVTFADGGIASGYFTLDANDDLVAVKIVTTAGTEFSGAVYDSTVYWGAGELINPTTRPYDSHFMNISNSLLTATIVFDFVSLSTTQPFVLTPTSTYPGED